MRRNQVAEIRQRSRIEVAAAREEEQDFLMQHAAQLRFLEDEVQAEQRAADEERLAAEERARRTQAGSCDAATAVGRSLRLASDLLRPKGDMMETQSSLRSTLDLLRLLADNLRLVSEETTLDGSGLRLMPGVSDAEQVRQELRNCAMRVADDWKLIAEEARRGRGHRDQARVIVEELHACRERSTKLEEELKRHQHEVSELQQSIDFERRESRAVLSDQRWFVPRVESALRDLSDQQGALEANRGSSSCSALHSSNWAGYNCDRLMPCLRHRSRCACGGL